MYTSILKVQAECVAGIESFLFVSHKFMGKIEKYFKRSVPLLISKTARIYRRLHAEEHMGKILYNL